MNKKLNLPNDEENVLISYYEAARAEIVERIRLCDNTILIYFALAAALSGMAFRKAETPLQMVWTVPQMTGTVSQTVQAGSELGDSSGVLLLVPCLAIGAIFIVATHQVTISILERYCGSELGIHISSNTLSWDNSKIRREHSHFISAIRSCSHGFLIIAPAVAAEVANFKYHDKFKESPVEAILWYVGFACVAYSIFFERKTYKLRCKISNGIT